MTELQLVDLHKSFGGIHALKGLSLTLGRGEILSLIGPNGAGKTTLFNVITGVYKPDRGNILFRNESIVNLFPHEICKKGIVRTFQIVKPFGSLTVLENVMIGGFNKNLSLNAARREGFEYLDLVNLKSKSDELAANLTITETRKLELARTLATKPNLLLLDEIMAGLNHKEIEGMVELIRSIRDRNVTIFVIEHIMEAVMSMSDRLVVINYGEKIAEGKPQDLARDPKVISSYLGKEYTFAKN